MTDSFPRRLLAEFLGTVVVGSGIAAQQPSPNDVVIPEHHRTSHPARER
ncbi:MAG: hypothetical protein J2P22_16835 [Nocardioides sp.]|nr:hypothetical protein [Nocardioides sp.]